MEQIDHLLQALAMPEQVHCGCGSQAERGQVVGEEADKRQTVRDIELEAQ